MRPFHPIAILIGAAFAAGCSDMHLPLLSRAGAPSLVDDTGLRNTANPNGPYAKAFGAPKLVARPATLDVGDAPPCNPDRLGLFESEARSSGSRRLIRLTFSNHGAACRIGGFPSLTLLGADGSVLGAVRFEQVSAARLTATLLPGPLPAGQAVNGEPNISPEVFLPGNGGASFELSWTTGEDCEEADRIAVSAPGAARPLLLNRRLRVCDGRVSLTALASDE